MIGLGSNLEGPLGGPEKYLELALAGLARTEGVSALRCSGFYRSSPWGKPDQDEFVNAVAEASCTLEPVALLRVLLDLEKDLGRLRAEKWGPRLIDLDLLCLGELRLDSEGLVLPHPHMHERAFVLVPLLDLIPDFEIPGIGPARKCLAKLDGQQSVRPV